MNASMALAPVGLSWHKGAATTIDVYREWDGSALVQMAVQAEHLDKLPEDRGCGYDVPDLEEPIIRLEIDGENFRLHLTPQRARQLAAALLANADAIKSARPLHQQSGVI